MVVSHLLRNLPEKVLLLFLSLMFACNLAIAEEAAEPEKQASPYAALVEILEDDAAREKLIEDLRGATIEDQPLEETALEAVEEADLGIEEVTLPRQIANLTQSIAQNLVGGVYDGIAAIGALAGSINDEATGEGTGLDLGKLSAAVINLALVAAVTLVVFVLLRRLARPLFNRINAWVTRGSNRHRLLRQTLGISGAAIVDLLVILSAWVIGYGVALFAIGEDGAMATRESLFLNAFLLVEVFKALIRMLFAARDDGLRMLPISAEEAAYWNLWLAKLSSFIGYGILLVVPVLNSNLSVAVGNLATLLIMALAFLYVLIVILQNRQSVREKLQLQAQSASLSATRVLLGMLARCWHILVIGYFLALAVVTVLRPEDALPLMLAATLQSLVAIGAGIFISTLLTQIIGRQIRVPEQTRLRYPMLEHRLNGFIPTTLKVIRVTLFIAVLAIVLDAWGLFNLAAWLASEAGVDAIGVAFSVALILVAATLLWIGIASWIEQRLNPAAGHGEPSAREKTLLTIFRNAVAITLVVITAMIVLAEVGVNIGPLIAGAGVLGLAIGFGAQKLVQDVITGVFIQLENAINTGDIVTAAGITGTAEKLTIRSLGIRDLAGTFYMIPFSSVDTVANYMREFAYHVGEYGVAYRENTDDVVLRLREAFEELVSDPEQRTKILDELEVHGVTALADSSVNVRVRIKTLPGAQWSVGREYNRLVKRHLDAAGIEIPFPHLTLYFGQDKDGAAPPAPLVIQQPEPTALPAKQRHDDSQSMSAEAKSNPKRNGDFDDEAGR